jgi:FkbM family methyltransferase
MLTLIKDSLRPLYRFLSQRKHREYYRLFSKYAEASRYQQRDIDFLGYHVTVADAMSFVYQFKEIFFEESYKFVATSGNPVIVDCGANIGLSCIYFKELYPKSTIHAFEADPSIFRLLKGNLERNLDMSAIRLVNAAIWINDDGVNFNTEGSDGGSVVATSDNSLHVKSVRLRTILMSHHIDLLKIDIEGAEADVLLDCDGALTAVDKIFFEYHSHTAQRQRLDELLSMIGRNGFRYFIQSPDHRDAPFLTTSADAAMDLQLNVYCYRAKS